MKKNDVIQRTLGGEQVLARVNWVVEDEFGYSFEPNQPINVDYLHGQGSIKEGVWQVVVSASPTYQSSVDSMSVEELQASLEGLRNQRKHVARPPRARVKSGEPAKKMSPLEKQLNKLSPEDRDAMMKKLGLVD